MKISLIEHVISTNDSRYLALKKFEEKYWDLIIKAPGSGHNHQSWEGGYYDHIVQCYEIAINLHNILDKNFKFSLDSVFIVLFFHDIEKIWKSEYEVFYIDKKHYYTSTLPEKYNINFTEEELNALTYIHGEGHEYSKTTRIMNELAGFCHACDVLSARCFHDKKEIKWNR